MVSSHQSQSSVAESRLGASFTDFTGCSYAVVTIEQAVLLLGPVITGNWAHLAACSSPSLTDSVHHDAKALHLEMKAAKSSLSVDHKAASFQVRCLPQHETHRAVQHPL